ncbi:MAG: hypothetical protein JRS35_23095 [Deltaproteobacteria bacterium]|nr:hypothetical protein [Deltaproteobacteria bacterium]
MRNTAKRRNHGLLAKWGKSPFKAMRWQPPAEFNMPPRKPDWSTAMPEAWAGLPAAFDDTGK